MMRTLWGKTAAAILILMMALGTVAVLPSIASADSFSNCTSVIGGVASEDVAKLVRGALNSYGCGSWLGMYWTREICWESRHWWGGWSRSFVRWATNGAYSTC